MSEYDDVRHLLDKGVWPNHEVPQWALTESSRLNTAPTFSGILMGAMQREIERLKAENKNQQSRLDELTDKLGMFEVALAKAEACN